MENTSMMNIEKYLKEMANVQNKFLEYLICEENIEDKKAGL